MMLSSPEKKGESRRGGLESVELVIGRRGNTEAGDLSSRVTRKVKKTERHLAA